MIVPDKNTLLTVDQILDSFEDDVLSYIEPFQCVQFILLKKKGVSFNVPQNLNWLYDEDKNRDYVDGTLYSIVIQHLVINGEDIFIANLAYEKHLNQNA